MDAKLEKLVKGVYLEALEEGKFIYLKVLGTSMYPFMRSNDILTIEPIKNNLEIGDIIIVDTDSKEKLRFIGHRVIKIEKKNGKISYFTKGDNFISGIQGPIPQEMIKGRVKEIKRGALTLDFDTFFIKMLNIMVAFLSYRLPWLLIGAGKGLRIFIKGLRYFCKGFE